MSVSVSRYAVWILVAGVLVGCGAQHVVLTAPPRTAPLPEREQAYQNLRLKAVSTETVTRTSATGMTTESSRSTWILGDGTEVYKLEDLRQVVDPDSETARHLNLALQAPEEHKTLRTATWITLLSGAAIMVAGIAVHNDAIGGVGALGVLASPIMYAVYLVKVSSTASEHAKEVPNLYNGDLMRHLNVVHTEEFSDTDANAPSSTAHPDEGSGEFEDTSGAAR
ncbi:MAG TPA: hypothetical protein VHM19_02090 [Polyangiales bacterium]|jgi:hypothetical protein|nr:hypothetical protein [Polyangiales bacterium]